MQDSKLQCRLVKPRDAAAYLAICERKLWELSKDDIIPVVRLGRATRYDLKDLDSFIQRAKGVAYDK